MLKHQVFQHLHAAFVNSQMTTLSHDHYGQEQTAEDSERFEEGGLYLGYIVLQDISHIRSDHQVLWATQDPQIMRSTQTHSVEHWGYHPQDS